MTTLRFRSIYTQPITRSLLVGEGSAILVPQPHPKDREVVAFIDEKNSAKGKLTMDLSCAIFILNATLLLPLFVIFVISFLLF